VVDLDVLLGEQLLDISVRQPETQVPADRQHDHIGRETEAGEGRPSDGNGAGAASSHCHSLPTAGSLTADATAPRLDDPGRPKAKGQTYRLLTTILDPTKAPAGELAALSHQRFQAEGLLDELKTHQRGPGVVLRSKTPEMVAQEIWAMLLVHRAIRTLMHQAALDDPNGEALDPDRLSLVRSLRVVRRQVTGQAAVSP